MSTTRTLLRRVCSGDFPALPSGPRCLVRKLLAYQSPGLFLAGAIQAPLLGHLRTGVFHRPFGALHPMRDGKMLHRNHSKAPDNSRRDAMAGMAGTDGLLAPEASKLLHLLPPGLRACLAAGDSLLVALDHGLASRRGRDALPSREGPSFPDAQGDAHGLLPRSAAKLAAVNVGYWLNLLFGRPALARATLLPRLTRSLASHVRGEVAQRAGVGFPMPAPSADPPRRKACYLQKHKSRRGPAPRAWTML